MSPENVDLLKAIVAAAATIIVGVLAFLGVYSQSRKPSTTKPPVNGDTGKALEAFNGTQNEFMAIVIADNKSLRADLTEVKNEVRGIKDNQESVLGAVRRYLLKIAMTWGLETHMPWPDDPDFHILEDTLPDHRVHRSITPKEK